MKRALLAILIFATGTTVFCGLRNANATAQKQLATQTSTWQTQNQQLVKLLFEKQQMLGRIGETQQQLAAQPSFPTHQPLVEKILSGDSLQDLSISEREQLRAELEFSWNTTGDYLIVSKQSLEAFSFSGMKGLKMTDTAREVLAITPPEQTAIETLTQQLGDARAVWAKEHVQRTEPSDNVLAQYALPIDEEFSQRQFVIFTNGVLAALGDQRGQLLQGHSLGWMVHVGLRTNVEFPPLTPAASALFAAISATAPQAQPATLTVERYQSGEEWRMNYMLKQAGNSMTTSVDPWQPFPEAFRPLFPGGWADLAKAEGFELPKEFKQQKAQ